MADDQNNVVFKQEHKKVQNSNTMRRIANVASTSKNPYVRAAGTTIRVADKLSKRQVANGENQNVDEKLARKGFGSRLGGLFGRQNDKSDDKSSDIATSKVVDSDNKDSDSFDLEDAAFNRKNKEKGTTDVTEEEKADVIKKIPLRVKIIIFCVIIFLAFFIFFITVIFSSVGSVLNWFDDDSKSSVYNYGNGIEAARSGCKDGIMVDNQVYSLEDYVAGVVTAEADPNQKLEALKAQAIAARTYAIVRTNNCRNSISNSEGDQVFTKNASADAITAASETEGLVLTYDFKLFLSEYDSFYKGGNYSCDSDGSCTVTYTKLPNEENHDVTISNLYTGLAAGGHGRGMSQVASYALADLGKNYEEILEYFYSPGVKIADINDVSGYNKGVSGSSTGTGFSIRNTAPRQGNENDDKFYYSSNNISFASGFVGECTWYAFGRANEILDSVGSNLKWNYANHAKTWYSYNLGLGSNGFSSSSNVNNPKVGAIIVWSHNNFGHVAIVEAVNDDGTLDYSESNVTSAKSSSNKYGFRYQSHISYVGTGVGTISNIWSGYNFVGYIYMIE